MARLAGAKQAIRSTREKIAAWWQFQLGTVSQDPSGASSVIDSPAGMCCAVLTRPRTKTRRLAGRFIQCTDQGPHDAPVPADAASN